MATEAIVCDTDVIIDYWNKNNQRHSTTQQILEKEFGLDNIAITAITQMELILGAKDKEDLVRINNKIQQFSIILIDNTITRSAIELLQFYRLSHGLAMPDAFIAATCKILNYKLFTHNVKDYRFIDGLSLYQG